MVLTGLAMAAVVAAGRQGPSPPLDRDRLEPPAPACGGARGLGHQARRAVGDLARSSRAFYCLGRWYWDGQYLFAMRVLGVAAMPLFVLSVPYVLWLDRYLVEPRDHAWHFGAMLIGREPWDADEVKRHWRAWIIKGFFSAFMISILPRGLRRGGRGRSRRDRRRSGAARHRCCSSCCS